MASWRDRTSPQAQDDLDTLLDIVLPFALDMLVKRGGFLPFGAAIALDGQPRFVAADPGLGEQPGSLPVLDLLIDGARRDADGLRAVAIATDVLADGTDAVCVDLEHLEGRAIRVLMPYGDTGGGVTYGSMSAGPGTTRFWDAV